MRAWDDSPEEKRLAEDWWATRMDVGAPTPPKGPTTGRDEHFMP